ncbi:MAG TPA: tetratricopeptide repeat protein [Gemmatimonadales bacterium]|nr:tetratricopeptide repeat protein [Gemmatimonadales bacterium]
MKRWLSAALLVVIAGALVWVVLARRPGAGGTPFKSGAKRIAASYVDNQTCAECHRNEFTEWTGSDHEQAMAPASDQTVRGNFANATFTNYGMTSRFFKKDGRFFVNTEAGDGRLQDFEIKYTFGIRPLQQYLIEFPGGRLQALGIAWDTKQRRWFHLYPNEKIAHDDPLHWTGLYQNWNLMCADCHSTNLKKNYDPATETYQTTWDVIDVSCQSCHGPGSAHVAWARRHVPRTTDSSQAIGLVVDVKSASPHDQVATCMPCHSRRSRLSPDDWAGRPYLDTFLPALLTPELYHADGQILGEDYEYGSFLQSRMYADGVRCTDCHNPHSVKLRADGNALCVRCHSVQGDARFAKLEAKAYDTPAHHFHPAGSSGARCVNCHMPAKTYMVVDPRRDHSFRIPRPDLSVKIGTPNACTGCHKEKTASWAAATVARWYGPARRHEPHYGEVIAAGRAGKREAEPQLIALVRDSTVPGIVRATALELLRGYGPEASQTMIAAVADADPLVRVAAVTGLDQATADEKLSVVPALLHDPIRAVRIEAARSLAGLVPDRLDSAGRAELAAGLAEYRQAQWYNSDVPGGNLNLAILETALQQFDSALIHYHTAIRLDPDFLPARVNLGNLYNQLGRNADAEREFREAVARAPQNGDLRYSLGLLLAEEHRLPEAVEQLDRAAQLLPDRPRVQYNYALALQGTGKMKQAEAALLDAYRLDSQDADVIYALALLYAQQAKWQRALPYARELVRLAPGAPEPAQLLQRIEMEQRGNR